MSSAEQSGARIRQAPGWWPNLVEVVHDECGYRGPVHDLNRGQAETVRARIERDTHECAERPWWS